MTIEEAKKVLLVLQDKIEYKLQFEIDETLKEYSKAIDVVIGEVFAMQNLLDEKNDEIEHLQKENKELIEVNKLVEKFPVDEMSDDVKLILITKGNFLTNPCFKNLLEDYISKKKIRKMIEKLKELLPTITNEDVKNRLDAKKQILEALLKEE